MIWYLATWVTTVQDTTSDPDPEVVYGHDITGPSDGGSLWVTTERYLVHAYHEGDGNCLVGFYSTPLSVPARWVAKTAPEAISRFTTVKGRAPTAKEIN